MFAGLRRRAQVQRDYDTANPYRAMVAVARIKSESAVSSSFHRAIFRFGAFVITAQILVEGVLRLYGRQ